jgi:hypothetical protein
MTEKKNWDNIPSLQDLSVDWEFEPENPLGKRKLSRLGGGNLRDLSGGKKIPVKVVAQQYDEKGLLQDISQSGLAVVVARPLALGQAVKVGLFLGQEKVIAKGLVRHIAPAAAAGHRIGIEFVDLPPQTDEFIASLVAAKLFSSPI